MSDRRIGIQIEVDSSDAEREIRQVDEELAETTEKVDEEVRESKQDLKEIEQKRQETERAVKETKQKANANLLVAWSAVRAGAEMIMGLMDIAGVGIGAVGKAVVTSAFNVGQTFLTLKAAYLAAGTVTPAMLISAILTGVAATIAIAGAVHAEQEQEQIMKNFQAVQTVNTFVGVFR